MNSEEMPKSRVLLFFSFSVFIFLTVIRLSTLDIFMDGVTYSSIARNMSVGLGGFWDLHYTETMYSHWFDFPPLSLFLQSLVFRFLGDHLIIDSLWGIFIGIMVITAIVFLCKISNFSRKHYWLPIFIFCLFPLVAWAFTNNILENLLTLFTVVAVTFCIMAVNGEKFFALISSIFILLAFLTKGFPGLFPFIIPFIFFILKKSDFQKMFKIYFLLLLPFVAGMLYFLFVNKNASRFFDNYIFSQVLGSLSGKREHAVSRFYILYRLLMELVVPIVVLLVIAASFKIKKHAILEKFDTYFLFFIITGLCASLPLLVSPKQSGFYLLPSLPYFAIALAYLFLEISAKIFEKTNPRIFVIASLIILIIAVLVPSIYRGKIKDGRNSDYISDILVHYDEINIPRGEKIFVCPASLTVEWGMLANMSRLYMSSFVTDPDITRYRLYDLHAPSCVPDFSVCKNLQNHSVKRYQLVQCVPFAQASLLP